MASTGAWSAAAAPAARAAASPRPRAGGGAGAGDDTAPAKPSFECNICLDAVSSPVVTLCGHLYCWPCLYQWMAQHTECPVCKSGVSEENVIPVYGRGTEAVDPRKQQDARANGVPDRPRGQRLDPELLRRRRPRNAFGMWDGSATAFTSSPTLGFFPAFFGAPFAPQPSPTHRADGTPLSPIAARQQMQQAFLSRLLLVVGSLVLLCLLTF